MSVVWGVIELTPLEKQALELLVQGYGASDIRTQLKISRSYTYQIIRQLKHRFGARTTAGVVACAIAKGVVSAMCDYED